MTDETRTSVRRRSRGWWHSARWTAIAALIGLVCASAICARSLPQPDKPGASTYLGWDSWDNFGTHWYHWVIHRDLDRGEFDLHTDRAYAPWGLDLGAQTGANFLDVLVAWPLYRLLGWPGCFNWTAVLLIALNFATFVPLGLRLFRGRAGLALLGAAIWAFNPVVLLQLATGQLRNAMVWPIPLLLLALLRTRDRRGVLWPLLAGGAAALVGYAFWYYALFMVPVVAAWVPLVRRPAGGWPRFAGRLALAGLVAALAVSPVLARCLGGAGGAPPGFEDGPGFALLETEFRRPDDRTLRDYLAHSPPAMERFELRTRTTPSPTPAGTPLILIPGAAVGLLLAFAFLGRRRLLLGGGMAVALTLSLGPILGSGDGWCSPLYAAASYAVPLYARLTAPHLQLVVFYLGLAIAAGYTFRATSHGDVHVRWLARAGAAALVGGLVVESAICGLMPLPATRYAYPACYGVLDELGEGHLIQLPFEQAEQFNIDQLHHGRAVMAGGHGFFPRRLQPEPFQELLESNQLVASLDEISRGYRHPLWYEAADLQQLTGLGYRFVVLHQARWTDERWALQDERIGEQFKRVAGDSTMLVYDLQRQLAAAPGGRPATEATIRR
jgi:hypothetical protein